MTNYKIKDEKLVESSTKEEEFSLEVINRSIADAQHNIAHHEDKLTLWQKRKTELEKLKK